MNETGKNIKTDVLSAQCIDIGNIFIKPDIGICLFNVSLSVKDGSSVTLFANPDAEISVACSDGHTGIMFARGTVRFIGFLEDNFYKLLSDDGPSSQRKIKFKKC